MGTEFAFHPGKISAPTDAMIFRYSLTEESISGSMRRSRTGAGEAADDAGTWANTVWHGAANAALMSTPVTRTAVWRICGSLLG
jgi:hypothetical protein